jgi:hypothetical protein
MAHFRLPIELLVCYSDEFGRYVSDTVQNQAKPVCRLDLEQIGNDSEIPKGVKLIASEQELPVKWLLNEKHVSR